MIIETMLTAANTPLIHAEALIVSGLSCRDSFDAKRRLDYVPALAGRCAR
jgi:hypothetical protein